MFLRAIPASCRHAIALLVMSGLCLSAAPAWAILTITINSPAENASVTRNQQVQFSVTANNSVAGIKHIHITTLDNFVIDLPGTSSDYSPSSTFSVTVNDPSFAFANIPAAQAFGSATLFTITVDDYVDGSFNASRHVIVAGPADTTAPTFSGIQSVTRLTGNTTANVTWNAATDAVTSPANMKYDIYYDTVQANVFTAGIKQTVTGVTTAQILPLTPLSSYYVGVRAKDEAGNSDTNTVTIKNDPLPNAVANWMDYR